MTHTTITPALTYELVCHAIPANTPRIAIIYDDNTHTIFAQQLNQWLDATCDVTLIHLGKRPTATIDTAQSIQQQATHCDLLIAVGSGTINDLTKYAAYQLDIPYIVAATAPSMNGYCSPTASLSSNGHKQSHTARAPIAVLAGLDILSQAPMRLIQAGLGDTLCRGTVQADWLLSHLLLGTDYDASVFEPLLPIEAALIARAHHIPERDPATIRLLMEALIASGQAMATVGSSAPASQGEHMIAHLYGMLYDAGDHYHGEEIAVTSATMATIQNNLLKRPPSLKKTASPSDIESLFNNNLSSEFNALYQKKNISPQHQEKRQQTLLSNWKTVQTSIHAVRIAPEDLIHALTQAGCPTTPAQLGWNEANYHHAVTHAHLTRDRFTFLDLAAPS